MFFFFFLNAVSVKENYIQIDFNFQTVIDFVRKGRFKMSSQTSNC